MVPLDKLELLPDDLQEKLEWLQDFNQEYMEKLLGGSGGEFQLVVIAVNEEGEVFMQSTQNDPRFLLNVAYDTVARACDQEDRAQVERSSRH